MRRSDSFWALLSCVSSVLENSDRETYISRINRLRVARQRRVVNTAINISKASRDIGPRDLLDRLVI